MPLLQLRPDRARIAADGADVSMVRVEVVDSKGRLVPTADHETAFTVSRGRLLGVGKGDPSSHESDRGPMRRAFNGLCMAIVQSSGKPGDLKIEASAKGLTGASVMVICEPAALRPAVA